MKHDYVIRMGSFRAVSALLEKTETSMVPGLVAARAAFVMAVEKAEALQQRQAERLAPVLERRDAAFGRMAEVTLRVAGLAVSHVARNGDMERVARLRITPKVLTIGAFARRLAAAQNLYDAIVDLQEGLAEAGVTTPVIAELQTAIAAAREQIAEPRNHVVGRVDATASLADQFRELTSVVRLQLDPLFQPLRLTHPALYRQYRTAQKQLRRPATRGRDEEIAAAPAGSTPVVSLNTGASRELEVKIAA